METNIIRRTVDLSGPRQVEALRGVLATTEENAHTFVISATRDGAPVALSGVVAGAFVLPDGTTVPLEDGYIEDGAAVVTLNASCYALPGRFELAIFATADGATVALYLACGSVVRSQTEEVVDPGDIIPSVQQLINDIDDAVARIPADYSALQSDVSSLNSNAVRTVSQSFGTQEKARARTNIGAADASVVEVLQGDVADLKSAMKAVSDLQPLSVMSGDYSGTTNMRIPQNIPAGTYHLHVDSITSADTDATTSQVYFTNAAASVTVLALQLPRGVAIDQDITLPSDAELVIVYASDSYLHSNGDTFSFTGFSIEEGYQLIDDMKRTFVNFAATESPYDCNDFVKSGIYPIPSGSGNTYQNFPSDFNAASYGGAVVVFDFYGNSRFVRQYLVYENSSVYYTRYKHLTTWDSWKKIDDNVSANAYSVFFSAGPTIDANALTNPGTYGLSSGLGASAYSNFPGDVNVNSKGGIVYTQRMTGNNTNFLRQFYTNDDDKVFYTRYKNISGFGTWAKLDFALAEKGFVTHASSGSPYDCNDYVTNGIFPVSSGSSSVYQNFPSDYDASRYGGALVVFDYYGNSRFLRQYLIYENDKIFYTRYKHLTTWDSWTKVELTKSQHVITGKKIALFGDSIMSGTIKTPSTDQTHCCAEYLQDELSIEVVDHSIGSIGYLAQVSGANILELAKSTDLTGCTFFVCSAGDNDWRYPIGTYTDTNAGYADAPATDSGATIMGQIYKLVDYLHTTYSDMTVILVDKPNAVKNASWPMYRRADGQWVKSFNDALKAFCNYYGVAYVSLDNCGMDAWLLNELLEPDEIHMTLKGYQKLMLYISGEVRKYTGQGDYTGE